VNQVKGTPNGSLFAATLGFAAGFAAVALFGPTASRFQEVMHLSPIMVGFLVSAPALSGSLLRIPFSAWVDTTGGRKPFLVLLTLSLVGMAGLLGLISALYPDHLSRNLYPVLLLLGVFCGCGIATFSVGISQVSYWFPQAKQGRALAIFGGVGNLAPGLFSFLLPVALASLGLAKSYAAWFVFLLAGTILYALLGRKQLEDVGAGMGLLHDLRRLHRVDRVVPDLLAVIFRCERGEGGAADSTLFRIDLRDSNRRRNALRPFA
jgi:NNP family nitrate/nitrite transporter-like MFS transporter